MLLVQEVRPAPPGVIDLELEKALLQVSILPMLTPIVDEQVPASQSVDEQVPVSESSIIREVAGSPVLDAFPSYLASPAGSVYGPITSPISPSLGTDDVSMPPSGLATMDQYLPRDSELLLGESTDLPLLPMPLTPPPMVEEMVLGSDVGSFDVHQDALESGASPRGCQYRMTSYDEDADRSDFSPAYGIHLHDPRLLEYVGTPESARLLSRSPEYWLHHMGRPDIVLSTGPLAIRHLPQQDVVGGHACGVRPGAVSDRGSAVRAAVSPCSMGGALHGGHGLVASTVYAGDSWPSAIVVMQRVHVLLRLFS